MLVNNVGLAGRYRITKIKDGLITYKGKWFDNLITNAGLDGLLISDNNYRFIFDRCQLQLGAGQQTPAFSDVNLAQFVLWTRFYDHNSNKQEQGINKQERYYWNRAYIRMPAKKEPYQIAELGVKNSYGYYLLSRALIKDDAGNNTTIAVLAGEELEVVWELRLYYNPDYEKKGSFKLIKNNGSYDVINYHLKPIQIEGSNGFVIDNFTGTYYELMPNKTELLDVRASADSWCKSRLYANNYLTRKDYIPGTFRRELFLYVNTNFSYNEELAQGFNAIYLNLGNNCRYQILLDKTIKKTNEQKLTLNFSYSIGRK